MHKGGGVFDGVAENVSQLFDQVKAFQINIWRLLHQVFTNCLACATSIDFRLQNAL